MYLLEVWKCDPRKAYELFQQFPAHENGSENAAAGLSYEEFLTYVKYVESESDPERVDPGRVPATKYVLVADDGEYVGIFNLRHELNDILARGAGHIGYGVAPVWRGQGFATEGLRLTLREARRRGIEEAYLAVRKDNPASLRVQQRLGARIVREDDLEYYTRISTNTTELTD